MATMKKQMIKPAVAISLVNEARGGPFVFWDDLAAGCQRAAELGYDAVEVFAPGPDAVDSGELKSFLEENRSGLAAMGTGAGMVKHGLTLTSTDADQRARAIAFVQSMIDFGASATSRKVSITKATSPRWKFHSTIMPRSPRCWDPTS